MDQDPKVRLVEVDAENWRALAEVKSKPGQERFVASVAWYLCLAHYGDDWHPLAIEVDGSIVGHLMWGIDEDEDDSAWLGGLVIDADAQGRGIGRAAVVAFLDRFTKDGRTNAGITFKPDNTIARKLYADIGFVETGEMAEDEIVARYQRS